MKLIIICGSRNPYILDELSSTFSSIACQCYETVEGFILALRKGLYSREELEIILSEEGFFDRDYEPVLTVLNSMAKKRAIPLKLLLITRNKKLYFCWKAFSTKNSFMKQEYTSDPIITGGHILYYSIPYLTSVFSIKNEVADQSESLNEVENKEKKDYVVNIPKAPCSYEFSMDSTTYSRIKKDRKICFTGSDWPLVLEVEKLVVSHTSSENAPLTSSVKNSDLPANIDSWERIYLVDNNDLRKSMENQTLLLYLQSYLPMKTLNKKIRILEADRSSSKILVHSVKDFLTR